MDLKVWQDLFRKESDFPAATPAQSAASDVLLALRKFEPELAELKSASQLPYARFPVQYQQEDPMAILLTHVQTLRGAARALLLRSEAELELSNSEQAVEDILMGFRLADTVKTEPFLISH